MVRKGTWTYGHIHVSVVPPYKRQWHMTRLRDLSTYCVLKAYKVWTSGPSPSEWQVQLGWGERRRSNPRPSWNATPGMKTVTHKYKLFETNHIDLYKILLNRIDLVNSSLYYQLYSLFNENKNNWYSWSCQRHLLDPCSRRWVSEQCLLPAMGKNYRSTDRGHFNIVTKDNILFCFRYHNRVHLRQWITCHF